jgi:type I restriction enzyme S subunit
MTTADWPIYKLGDVLTFQRGFDITKNEQRDGPYPVISSSGPKTTHAEYKVRGPGVVIGRKGSLGTVFYSASDYWPHDTTLWIKDFHGNDPRYAYYFLQTMGFERLDAGASNPSLNRNHIHIIPVKWPPIPIQRRIAGILSAYDELIENCQRRILILEEMARALYREWFVHFRFPDHEKVPRVDSPLGPIPKGWEVTNLGEELAALESGKRPKGGIRDVVGGVPSIGAENINGIGKHDFASEKFVPREFFDGMNKGTVRDRDVAIYKDGAYIGRSSYFRDSFPHAECCVNEHVFLLRTKGDRLTQNALYLWLQEPDTVHAIRATNANAAQPGINQPSVNGLELVVPDSTTSKQFDQLVEPLIAGITNHARRIQNLRRTRDLLLPRLLSGRVTLDVCQAPVEPEEHPSTRAERASKLLFPRV